MGETGSVALSARRINPHMSASAASHAFLDDGETGPPALRPLLRVAGIGPEPESAKDAWRRRGDQVPEDGASGPPWLPSRNGIVNPP